MSIGLKKVHAQRREEIRIFCLNIERIPILSICLNFSMATKYPYRLALYSVGVSEVTRDHNFASF